jgi:hypothetical protein
MFLQAPTMHLYLIVQKWDKPLMSKQVPQILHRLVIDADENVTAVMVSAVSVLNKKAKSHETAKPAA